MMRRTTKAALAMLLAGTGLAAALPLSAQTPQAPADTSAGHQMKGGDMGAMMKMMGFIRPHNVGPGWLKQGKPPKEELRGILDLEFANVFTSHGAAVVGSARDHYRPAIVRVS